MNWQEQHEFVLHRRFLMLLPIRKLYLHHLALRHQFTLFLRFMFNCKFMSGVSFMCAFIKIDTRGNIINSD